MAQQQRQITIQQLAPHRVMLDQPLPALQDQPVVEANSHHQLCVSTLLLKPSGEKLWQ